MLREFVETGRYSFREKFDSWEEAIAASCEPIIKEGVIEPVYVEAVINCVKKYGPYIIIAPNIAMPHSTEGAEGVNETAICFMGHGTEADSNAVYQKMQDMLKEEGFDNYYVGTVEATPSCEDVIAQVKEGSYKKVVLEPLMIVAGDHANNDMAGDDDDSWKSQFEAAGYEVTCLVRGLGELEPIQQLFVQHAQAAVGSLAK